MTPSLRLLEDLPARSRERLLELAAVAEFPDGARIFREGRRADRFWVLRGGSARLDIGVPTHAPVVLETLHRGDLLGWSWLFPPYEWHLGAQAMGRVSALEFDATAVRDLCDAEPELGYELTWHVARIIAHRLQQARVRLLDVYGPAHPSPVTEVSP